jgi:hypothetical protein
MATKPWNYHSHVTCCTECNGEGWVRAHRTPTIDDPYPERRCDHCHGEQTGPCCEVCWYDLPVDGYDCFACETIAALNDHELRRLNVAALAAALTVAAGKALAAQKVAA